MSKWLSVELSLLLLVSVVALAGLVSTNFGSDEESFDGDDLSGYAITVPVANVASSNEVASTKLSTGVFNGYPTKIITIPANNLVSKISGRTCFNHKKTGSIYGFRALAKTSGIVVWRKELGQFGGKGNKCQPINIEINPPISPETIEIQGYLVKGSPNAYNSVFDVFHINKFFIDQNSKFILGDVCFVDIKKCKGIAFENRGIKYPFSFGNDSDYKIGFVTFDIIKTGLSTNVELNDFSRLEEKRFNSLFEGAKIHPVCMSAVTQKSTPGSYFWYISDSRDGKFPFCGTVLPKGQFPPQNAKVI